MSSPVETLVNREYRYGFHNGHRVRRHAERLNEDVIRLISGKKKSRRSCSSGGSRRIAAGSRCPSALAERRLSADRLSGAQLLRRTQDHQAGGQLGRCRSQASRNLRELGIPLSEQKILAGVAVDCHLRQRFRSAPATRRSSARPHHLLLFREALQEHPS